MLGISREQLRDARRAGVVNPRPFGRGYRYSDADLATFRASRPKGVTAKQAAAALGISRTQLARYRNAGRLRPVPAAGRERVRYVYDPSELAAFHG